MPRTLRLLLLGIVLCALAARRARSAEVATGEFRGAGSCAAYGCHGNTQAEPSAVWKGSYVIWKRHDPHQQAFETLFSARSRRIVATLASAEDWSPSTVKRAPHASGEAGTNQATAEDVWRILNTRCIGCHATPVQSRPTTETRPAAMREAIAALRGGVTCESCHGASQPWLAEHATTRWLSYAAEERRAPWGYRETQQLIHRAAVCVECHVGPFPSADVEARYDVTHELIAAGHPPLRFEFSAYLANLPPHWDLARDRARHGGEHFHFDAWRAGQLHEAAQWAKQLAIRTAPDEAAAPSGSWPDFANYDCFACHHRLHAGRAWQSERPLQPAEGAWNRIVWLTVPESPEQHAFAALTSQARVQLAWQSPHSAAERQAFFQDLAARWSQLLLTQPAPAGDTPSAEQTIHRLVSEAHRSPVNTWEGLIQLQLALAAYLADHPPADQGDTLRRQTERLADYLQRQYEAPSTVSIYSSPAKWNPQDPELRELLRSLVESLPTRAPRK